MKLCAAAVQAARLGVKRIVLVNDIEWLGGQFSAESVGCLDAWTTVNGQLKGFPRSGLFLEMIERIHAYNTAKYRARRDEKLMIKTRLTMDASDWRA